MNVKHVKTTPYAGQKPGTSGLRKKVREFEQPGYLENFVQAVFNTLGDVSGQRLVLAARPKKLRQTSGVFDTQGYVDGKVVYDGVIKGMVIPQ